MGSDGDMKRHTETCRARERTKDRHTKNVMWGMDSQRISSVSAGSVPDDFRQCQSALRAFARARDHKQIKTDQAINNHWRTGRVNIQGCRPQDCQTLLKHQVLAKTQGDPSCSQDSGKGAHHGTSVETAPQIRGYCPEGFGTPCWGPMLDSPNPSCSRGDTEIPRGGA